MAGPNPLAQARQEPPASAVTRLLSKDERYERSRHLPKLLHLFPEEAERLEHKEPGILVERLTRALWAERRRGKSGHWRYSLARHISLSQALACEQARLKHCQKITRQSLGPSA